MIDNLYYAFQQHGFSVLHFNFRGVGRSEGLFDNGPGELADAATALQAYNADAGSCWIAGVSFGAWIAMQLLMPAALKVDADVDDHAAGRVHDVEPGANRGSHGLFDEERLAGAGVERGIVNGALFDFSDAAGDADDDAGARDAEAVTLVHSANEVVQHALGDVEVGDDAVFEGANRDDVRGGTTDHALGLGADCQHLLGHAVDRYNRGLVDDNAATLDHDKSVGGT